MLAKTSATVQARAQAQLMINQAQEIIDAVAKDGSSGVHAPNYTKAKVEEAKLLAAGARVVAQGGTPEKVASKK